MNKKTAAFSLVWTLVFALVTTSVCAQSAARTESTSVVADAHSQNTSVAVNEGKQNEKLKADMLKLVADTKAGKVSPRMNSQFPPSHSNSLSKGAKIAIVVGIAVVIFAIIAVHSIKNISCESRCVL